MSTDINHLHDVIEGKIVGRQCGKTFASIHQLAGFVELKHPTIVVIINHYRELQYLFNMIETVFTEHQLNSVKCNFKDKKIYVEHTVILFISEHDKEIKTRGLEYLLHYLLH